jgi:transcriptional regulator with XRE-family HTH domain
MARSFSQTLFDIRKNLGLTQKQLGKSLGVSHSRISTWELGDRIPDPVIEHAVTVKLEVLRARSRRLKVVAQSVDRTRYSD